LKTIFKYISLVTFLLLVVSCSHKIQLKENEFLLGEQDFSGNEKVHSEDLAKLIPLNQRPNNKPLNIPWIQFTPKVWLYNYGLNRFDSLKQNRKLVSYQIKLSKYPDEFTANSRTERIKQKIRRKLRSTEDNLEARNTWLWRNIGEPQSVIDKDKAERTSEIIEKYIKDIGYKDAKVSFNMEAQLTTDKSKLTYKVKEGPGYRIDTVFYDIKDPQLDSLIRAHNKEQRISPGSLFSIQNVEAEKARIELLAKQNGYYDFLSQFIIHEAINANYDEAEFREKKRGNLRFTIVNPPNQKSHRSYRIKEVVFKGFDPYSTLLTNDSDTVLVNKVKYITIGGTLPEKVLDKKVISRPGEVYNIDDISETQRQIGLLNQFAFASSQINPLNDKEISLEYFAPQLQKYSISTGPGLNHVYNGGSGFLGFGVPVTLSARNLFKRLEIVEASARVFREGQPSPLGTTDVRGSWEIGTNVSVTLPNIAFLGKDIEKLKLKNPRSQLGIGYNYSEPFWGQRLNLTLNGNFRLQPTKYSSFFVSLLDANLISTDYNLNDEAGLSFYNSLLEQEALGNNLKTTFDPQFVSSINTSYVFNDQDLQKPYASSKFLRLFIESGGTLLNFSKDKNQIDLLEKLFPDPNRKYFRFIKINVDYRRYINLAPSASLAYRLNIGVTNPYGNKSMPYQKNFFVGGSNSVRAWSPRSLGVGSALPDTASGNIIPQTGDILIEGSIEVRKKVARFFGDIQLAAFVDFGNIWKWYQIETDTKRDKANFDFDRFYKEIAVGTGLGIRYDLSYFQFRFDWGIKVMDPARDPGDRFVLDEFTFKRNSSYGLNFNLGIGYPF